MSYGCVLCTDCLWYVHEDFTGGCKRFWPAKNSKTCPAFKWCDERDEQPEPPVESDEGDQDEHM